MIHMKYQNLIWFHKEVITIKIFSAAKFSVVLYLVPTKCHLLITFENSLDPD